MSIAHCPNDSSHKRFTAIAHVTQDWTVDEHGRYLGTVGSGAIPRDIDSLGDVWSCQECGTEAIVMGLAVATLTELALTVPMSVPIERIRDLLLCAFEGGSNYWYAGLHIISLVTVDEDADTHQFHIVPTVVGGRVGLYVDDEPDKLLTLDLEVIRKGLETMACKYPRHWGEFLAENEDGETGDVFLQCCVFGDIIYG